MYSKCISMCTCLGEITLSFQNSNKGYCRLSIPEISVCHHFLSGNSIIWPPCFYSYVTIHHVTSYPLFHQMITQSKNETNQHGQLIHKSIKKRIFQAFISVSGSSSAEQGSTDTNACWKMLWILSLFGKNPFLDGFLSLFVDSHRDA